MDYVFDFQQVDINGDSVIDTIYLVGDTPYGDESSFVKNISILIQDGKTNAVYQINPKENAGYNPTLFIGDFTGDNENEILLSIDSGGSGGYAFYYIYSTLNNVSTVLFDYEIYNQEYTYKVTYQDNYQVAVVVMILHPIQLTLNIKVRII